MSDSVGIIKNIISYCEHCNSNNSAHVLLLFVQIQSGFGHVGSHFWAFETSVVVPDIGKPCH